MLRLKPPPSKVASESLSPFETHTRQDTQLHFLFKSHLFPCSIYQQTQSTRVQRLLGNKVMGKVNISLCFSTKKASTHKPFICIF